MKPLRVPVRIGEVRVAADNQILFTVGLGSCVAIALYDAEARVGGLAHVMLPKPLSPRRATPPGRFANLAVPQLIEMMEQEGASVTRMRARLVGGASMFAALLPERGLKLGKRNAEASRRALREAGIPIDAEEVGGEHGRSVYLHTADGTLQVTSVLNEDITI